MTFLLLLLLSLAPTGEGVRVAVLQSGTRVECVELPGPGAPSFLTPFGLFPCPRDPVVRTVDATEEALALAAMRTEEEFIYEAWLRRADARGLLTELAAGAAERLAEEPACALTLDLLEKWGGRVDLRGTPPLDPKDFGDWMQARVERSDPVQAALFGGRLLRETGEEPQALLTIADLRRWLRARNPYLRRLASGVAERQKEWQVRLPLYELFREEPSRGVWERTIRSLASIDMVSAENLLTLDLFRADEPLRTRAAEMLGLYGKTEYSVEALMMTLATRPARAPGAYAFFGRQVSVVSDFDVELAPAAVLARPHISILEEGMRVRVRVISADFQKTVMRSLKLRTGADPGPSPSHWLHWYSENRPASLDESRRREREEARRLREQTGQGTP